MKVLFRGKTEECFSHFTNNLAITQVPEAHQLMAKFTGASLSTVSRWNTAGRGLPTGLNLIKLRFFLTMIGYEVAELNEVKKPILALVEMLALSVISENEASSKLGLTVGGIYRISHGKGSTTSKNISGIQNLYQTHLEKLRASKAFWERQLSSPPSSSMTTPAIEPKKREEPNLLQEAKEDNLLRLGYLILAATKLAEAAASDQYTAEERKQLREMTGGDNVFRLSNALNKLCGEKAREMILKNGRAPKEETV